MNKIKFSLLVFLFCACTQKDVLESHRGPEEAFVDFLNSSATLFFMSHSHLNRSVSQRLSESGLISENLINPGGVDNTKKDLQESASSLDALLKYTVFLWGESRVFATRLNEVKMFEHDELMLRVKHCSETKGNILEDKVFISGWLAETNKHKSDLLSMITSESLIGELENYYMAINSVLALETTKIRNMGITDLSASFMELSEFASDEELDSLMVSAELAMKEIHDEGSGNLMILESIDYDSLPDSPLNLQELFDISFKVNTYIANPIMLEVDKWYDIWNSTALSEASWRMQAWHTDAVTNNRKEFDSLTMSFIDTRIFGEALKYSNIIR